jgi:hypothetical protein
VSRINPTFVNAVICRAKIHAGKSEWNLAISELNEAIRLDPRPC